jgi:hypothetical protein
LALMAHFGIIKEVEGADSGKIKWRVTSGGERLLEDYAAKIKHFIRTS